MAGPPHSSPAPVVTVEELAAPATDLLAAAMGADADRIPLRLARGCRCFGACRDGRLAGYGWLSAGPEWIGEAGVEVRPGPGEAYVWNCVTLPADRRNGVFGSLLSHLVAVARAERVRRLWIASAAGGAPGAVVAAGFAPVLVVDSRLAGPARIIRAAPAPGAARADVEAARAALGLNAPISVRRSAARKH